MAEETNEDKPKPGYLETPAANPDGEGTVTAYVSIDKARHFERYGPMYKFHELKYLVREALVDPHRIYPHHDDDYEGLCYTKRANYSMRNDGTRDGPPRGDVFTVFVDSSFRVGDWGWERADTDDEWLPVVHANRLEEPIWSRTK